MLILLLILAAFVVGLIAGAMAYVIHYNEYQHHLRGNQPFKESLKSASISFFFFFIVTLLVGIIMYHLFE